ncbi:MAG TPA: cell shape-determining protein, partial [Flavobacteriaceae bacterium]|nr:cell shape-determining protein [Flavobacteriaceae bacterium]
MIELASVIIFGILAQWFAWRFKIPAILPLLLIGLLIGPFSTFYTEDGTKWLEPIWNGTKGLFPGESLFYFVSLSISIILFEGGLTLKLKEVRNVSSVISKLITLGSLVTFFGAAIAVYYIFNLSWEISFLFSALIIVTGPTVITPILRNVPLKRDISAILKWEGILIDPIGALVAVLVFEFISVGDSHAFTKTAFMEFGKIVLFGSTFGFTFAHAMVFIVKNKLVPHYLMNVFSLATVLAVFVLSDAFAHESGLLAVVVMGMVIGNIGLPNLKELLYFKESLSVLLISILFILLSANINVSDLLAIYNWNTLYLFLAVVFLIRPIGVFLSTMNSTLKTNEKLFISWVGPRGIVAAGIASLFGLKLVNLGVKGAEYITPLVFMIVLGTVLLNATTARFMAKVFGVFLKKSNGVLIVGAGEFSRIIAKYLDDNNRHVVLVDSNSDNVKKAKALGLEAINEDIFSEELSNNIELTDIGYLMALTANSNINSHCITKFQEQFGEYGSFRLITPEERYDKQNNPKEGLFSHTDDFVKLAKIVREHPEIHEIEVLSEEHYTTLLKEIHENDNIVALFTKLENGDLRIISASNGIGVNVEKGFKMVY